MLAWFDGIQTGLRYKPRVEVWPRGGGKSATYELGLTRLAVKLTRRFALIVSDTQSQADSHVQSVAAFLLQAGASPAISVQGRPRGWRRDQLQTKNGFYVAGFGVEGGQRGIRVEEFRPDIIIFDDVDGRHDSPDAVAKKVECITESIMPAGSPDCIYLWIENVIHSNSITQQLIDERADFLLDREIAVVEPAVWGLTYDTVPRDGRKPLYRITGGTPTWAGQDLATCEYQINAWSLETFLRESQHAVWYGSAFFDQWDDTRHRQPAKYAPESPPPSWWRYYGGLDDGYDDPFAFVLYGVDARGKVHGMGALQERRLTNVQKAERVAMLLEEWHIPREHCTIGYDETMRNRPSVNGVKGESGVQVFHNAGFSMVPVANNADAQTNGFMYIRELLRVPGSPSPAIEVWDGYADRIVTALSTATHDKTHPEKINHDGASHICQATRYAVAMRMDKAEPPTTDASQVRWVYPGPDGGRVAVIAREEDLPAALRSPVHDETGQYPDWYDPANPGWY